MVHLEQSDKIETCYTEGSKDVKIRLNQCSSFHNDTHKDTRNDAIQAFFLRNEE